MADRVCPDGGACHHGCSEADCFRVRTCGPLSGVYPGDVWPAGVVEHFDGGRLRRLAEDAERALVALFDADPWLFGIVAVDAHVAATFSMVESNLGKARESLAEIPEDVERYLEQRKAKGG